LTGSPLVFVQEFLHQLDSQGHLKVVLNTGGSRVTAISPALKRLLT